MFTKLRSSKLGASGGDLPDKRSVLANRSANSNKSDNNILMSANLNELNTNDFNKSTVDQQNMIDLGEHLDLDSAFSDQLNRRLSSDPLEEERNVFDFLGQIRDQTNNLVNEETDNDSVQILDECDSRESVRALGHNSVSELLTASDDFIIYRNEDEGESENSNNPEIDNASVIVLNSSNDSSTTDLLNNDFGANDADAMSMFVNLSQDRSPSTSPDASRLNSPPEENHNLENFMRTIRTMTDGDQNAAQSDSPLQSRLDTMNNATYEDFGLIHNSNNLNSIFNNQQPTSNNSTSTTTSNYPQRLTARMRTNRRPNRPLPHDRHSIGSNAVRDAFNNAGSSNRNHRSHRNERLSPVSQLQALGCSRMPSFQPSTFAPMSRQRQYESQEPQPPSYFGAHYMANNPTNLHPSHIAPNGSPYPTCPFSYVPQPYYNTYQPYHYGPVQSSFVQQSQPPNIGQSALDLSNSANRRQNAVPNNYPTNYMVTPPQPFQINLISNNTVNMSQAHYEVNNNQQQQRLQHQHLPTQIPLVTIQHMPISAQSQSPIRSSHVRPVLQPNSTTSFMTDTPRSSNVVYHPTNNNMSSRAPLPPIPQPPALPLLSFLNSNLRQNNFQPYSNRTRNLFRRMWPTLQEFHNRNYSNTRPSSIPSSTMSSSMRMVDDNILNEFMRTIDDMSHYNGADPTTIQSFTTESKYKKNTKQDKSKSNDAVEDEEDEKCAICWSEFDEDEDLRRLGCFHFFHRECVDRWLKMNKTCPVCREDITRSLLT